MKLQGAIQEALLSLLCYNADRGAEVVALLTPNDFDPVYREIAAAAIDYRNRHGQPPGEHTLDLFESAKEINDELAAAFDKVFVSVEATASELNPDFILERAGKFVRFQRLKAGIAGSLRELSHETEEGLRAAEATLTKALRAGEPAMDFGVEFADDLDASTAFLNAPSEAFPTGIKEFDRFQLGPRRGTLHMLLAPFGRGKSWWLIQLAHEARKHGKGVLYVTLEMSPDDVCQRMVQRALGVPKRKLKEVRWTQFVQTKDPADRGLRTKEIVVKKKWSLESDNAERNVRRRLRLLQGQGRTVICGFPTSSLSVEGLDNHLTIMAERMKFIPDLILVDYADLMKPPPDLKGYEGSIEIGKGLRRIAQTWKVGMASVSQVTSEGLKAKRVDVEHQANARGNFGTYDTAITYSQSDAERSRGLARLFVAKARMDEDRFTVLISQNYATGRFVCDSTRMGENYSVEESK